MTHSYLLQGRKEDYFYKGRKVDVIVDLAEHSASRQNAKPGEIVAVVGYGEVFMCYEAKENAQVHMACVEFINPKEVEVRDRELNS